MKPVRTLTAALLLAGAAVVFSAAPAYAENIPTEPPEGASDQVCEEGDSTKIDLDGTDSTFVITAEEGFVITAFCVKAGDDASDAGVEYYLVDPPTNTVTISHSTGKGISHYSFIQEEPEPEPTPTPTPTPEPTPEPTTPPAGGGDGGAKLAETGFDAGWMPFAGIGLLALGAALFVPRLVAKRR
jgi:LPXTG-motif cell wall-anchored protein